MDLAFLCRAFFSLGTAVVLGGALIPSFREQIMNYGPRSTPSQPSTTARSHDKLTSLLRYIGSAQTPHTWFTHYYVASVSSSIFWGFQMFTNGRVMEFLASYSEESRGMTANQVFLAWLLMALQGTRRLYESLTQMKPSQSKMWAGLWGIGIAFYIIIGISIWAEGIPAISRSNSFTSGLDFSLPSRKSVLALLIFFIASAVQHVCHKHLASLKKYTLPRQFYFQSIVCPHYTSECFIYLAIAMISAQPGHLLNGTVLAGMGFVVSNLAVTADSTRKWYVAKFGEEELADRWRMVPYIY